MVPMPVEEVEHRLRRALLLLAAFILGCAVVAALVATGLGGVWRDVYEWLSAQLTGDALG
ncbi:hypothetical protein AA0Y32_15595 [Georgenia phoenicis]|uniref:hypothetical protein n=1 Tax=unclassified Georgenia TaxID=2626815 RepID=UPI0039B0F3B0